MPALTVDIHLTPAQLLRYYRGQARAVQARATTGQLVQFPAAALQRHVTPDGIHGLFELEFDADHKFVRLDRVDTR